MQHYRVISILGVDYDYKPIYYPEQTFVITSFDFMIKKFLAQGAHMSYDYQIFCCTFDTRTNLYHEYYFAKFCRGYF